MRAISSQLTNDIQGELQTTCTCLRVVRKDGTQFGFTTTDIGFNYTFTTTPDDYGSLFYTPVASFEPSAIRSTETTSVDNLEIVGIFSLDAITPHDLIGGIYDEAIITIFTVNFMQLNHGEYIKEHGYVGQVIKTDGMYKVEIMSLIGRLKKFIGIVTSPGCRVKVFADGVYPFSTVNGLSMSASGQCKLNPDPFTFAVTISYVTDAINLGFVDGTHATNYFADGIMTFTSGNNIGIAREIQSHVLASGIAEIVLSDEFPFPIEVGDNCNVIMGCPRLFGFCRALGNARNYRGEPFLPGNAITTQIGYATGSAGGGK